MGVARSSGAGAGGRSSASTPNSKQRDREGGEKKRKEDLTINL